MCPVTLSAQGPLDSGVAFDGWVGAVLGALASILIALYVLRSSLKHERSLFKEQLAEEREAFLEQSERDRKLFMEQERIRAFADLAAELMRAEDRILNMTVDDALLPVVSAFHRWTLYIPDLDDEFVRGVNRGIATVRETAMNAVRVTGGRADDGRPKDAKAAAVHFDAHGGGEDVHWIIGRGRMWHQHPERRPELGRTIVERFPRRMSIDLDTGEATQV